MFDFYKEIILEMQGIKPEKKLDKDREYIGDEKLKPILSKKIKITVWILGLFYLIVAGIGIVSSVKTKEYLGLSKYILLILIDVTAMILCMFKNGKIQKVAIGFIITFIVLNFGTTLLGK